MQRLARHRQVGLSYVETLIAAVVLSLAILPATIGLQNAIRTSQYADDFLQRHFEVLDKMETVLAAPFADLESAASGAATPSAYSDPAESDHQRLVYIVPADGDNADGDDNLETGADSGLLLVRVVLADGRHQLEALLSRP